VVDADRRRDQLAARRVRETQRQALKNERLRLDYAGYVTDWQNGALDTPKAACRTGVRFYRPAGSSDQTILGDGNFASDLPAMRAAKPFVSEISIGYPQEISPESIAP
jgi:hypothetical protein